MRMISGIDRSADEAGHQPMHPAGTERDPVGNDDRQQRVAGAVQHPAEHVAPILVRTEQMIERGRRQRAGQVLVGRIVWRDQRRQDGQRQETSTRIASRSRTRAAAQQGGRSLAAPGFRTIGRAGDRDAHARRILGSRKL